MSNDLKNVCSLFLDFCHAELGNKLFLIVLPLLRRGQGRGCTASFVIKTLKRPRNESGARLIQGDVKKFFYKYILNRTYYRYGSCKRCGDCCSKIYVKHKSGVIKDEEEFKKLQKLHPFYSGLEIIDKDEQGLVFKCLKFDREKKICTIHKWRSLICRKYPSEEIFKFNGVMSENCGYYFKPIESFKEVLEKIRKHK